MDEKKLEKYRQRLKNQRPIVGGWLRSSALNKLRREAAAGDEEAREELCRLVIEQGHSDARRIALAVGYAPCDVHQRALFYFLTEQWEKYESLDFDHAMLRTIYEAAVENQQRRIAEKAREAGRVEWVEVVSGGRQGRRLEKMTDAEWETALTVLGDGKRFDEMWRLAQVAPPKRSKPFLQRLKASGWKSKEEEVFGTLTALSEKCPDKNLWLDESPLGWVTLAGHTESVWSLAISPDGRVLASGSYDRTVRLWSLPDGMLLKTLEGQYGYSLAISPDGRVLASGGGSLDNGVRLWSLPDGALLKVLEGHADWVNCLAISPDGRVLASGSDDHTVRLWSLPYGSLLKALEGHRESVQCLAISPDGRVLASGSVVDPTMRLWSFPDGALLKTLDGQADWLVDCIAISPNGRVLASGGCFDNGVRLWGLPDGSLLKVLEGHADRVSCLAISPDGRVLASGSVDKTVRLWSLPDGSLLKTLEGHTESVGHLAISPDGRVLASGSVDHTVRLWSLLDGSLLKTLEGHTESVQCLAISPDGRVLASGSDDHTVQVWTSRLVDLSCLPVNQTTLEDLAWAQQTLRGSDLSPGNRNWLEFIVVLMERHRQFDIDVGDSICHIAVGQFDIEVGG